MTEITPRTDWTRDEIGALFDLPFNDLMFEAQSIHRANFPRNEVQLSTLLSIKTGGCPEDCGYCSQSTEAESGLKATKLMDVQAVLQAAAQAKDHGSGRFCMGAAWRNPKERDMPKLIEMVKGVRQMGMETCMTLGMLSSDQAKQLADAGLDYYNHNIDTSPENYANVITTRTFEDRIETLENVRSAGINVCCGGMRHGAGGRDRAGRHAEGHAARQDRRGGVRPHRRGGADRLAAIDGAAVCGSREHERSLSGAMLHGGREQHLYWRQAADGGERWRRQG